MEGTRKLLITQGTEHSNLFITEGLNTNILQFIHEKLILLLQFITGIFTYLPEKILQFIHEKFILLLQFVTGIITYLPEMFLPYIHEKFILFLHFVTGIFTYLTEKFNEIINFLYPELIKRKLAIVLQFIKDILIYLSEKFDEIFPPETRSETFHYWLHILLTVVIPACLAVFVFCWFFSVICQAVLRCCSLFCGCCARAFSVVCPICSQVFYALYGCCSQVLHAVYGCCCYCFQHGEVLGTMMKAPGRAGVLMLRSTFENSPRLYFIGLRAAQRAVF